MKKIFIILMLLFCVLSFLSCSNGGKTSGRASPDDNRIPVISGLKARDINSIDVSASVKNIELTDEKDIEICLSGLQGIKLREKSDEAVPEFTRGFIFTLKTGASKTIKFGYNKINFGEGSYYFDESDSPLVHGKVRLTTQGNTHEPYDWWIFSHEYSGTYADGMWFGKGAFNFNKEQEVRFDQLETIPYLDDFKFKVIWDADPDKIIEPEYDVFDSQLNRLSHCMPDYRIPDVKGIYYIAVFMRWGTDYRYEGYQYIYKIERI